MFHLTTRRDTLLNSTLSTELASTPDAMTKFLEDPFGTWQTTLLFIVLLMALGICVGFLGTRYAEVLRFNTFSYDTLPLTLEGRQPKRSANGGEVAACLFAETPITQASRLHDDDQFNLRRRPGTANVRPNFVAIGQVQEGTIAQRRASLPTGAGTNTNVRGRLELKPVQIQESQSMLSKKAMSMVRFGADITIMRSAWFEEATDNKDSRSIDL
ncbi:uncharacterized protein Z519_07587 [Cladophialophora bantiana CBS 173.52]|uniref:Uncharacterized protein n=1 Tax=Cladophialophora bantiana (strain ATCC 10958 / CBS 173.52 / CDC B-1940 / NIH 8579) TaxID=1442370 RepID=A0A0D2I403_CLAB1|nr:uncharacterized protein Z519_07587 [Cladophialophora bantiana CBS 173.52]KIW91619.1 hypothetical protein Z519_07587 [Cladophialophora bantiana CBS 173.52]